MTSDCALVFLAGPAAEILGHARCIPRRPPQPQERPRARP